MPICTLPPDIPVAIDLEARSEEDAIRAVARLLEGNQSVIDHAQFVEAVLERQKINPPLLGNGIALPHARSGSVAEIVFAAARCREPVMFREMPIRIILLFGVPPHRIAEYLAMTASLARRLRDPDCLEGLLKAPDSTAFQRALRGV